MTTDITWTTGNANNVTRVFNLEYLAEYNAYDVDVENPTHIINGGTPQDFLTMIGCDFEIVPTNNMKILISINSNDIVIRFSDGTFRLISLF